MPGHSAQIAPQTVHASSRILTPVTPRRETACVSPAGPVTIVKPTSTSAPIMPGTHVPVIPYVSTLMGLTSADVILALLLLVVLA